MDNIYIQVIDPSPEQAQEINSILRNSGINVHILHSDNLQDSERQIREFQPALVIYHSASNDRIPIARIGEMSRVHGVFMAVRFEPHDPSVFLQALAETACIGLDASENDRLIELVKLLSGMGRAARELNAARGLQDELQKRYELLLDTTTEAVAYLHEGLHVFANSAYLDALQVQDFSELESLSMLDIVHSDQMDLKTLIREFSQGKFPPEPLIATVRDRNGGEFEAQLTFKPVSFGGEHCVQKVIRKTGKGTDLRQELNRVRLLDPLTGMFHRRHFMQQLDQCLENPDDAKAVGVFFLEPDGIRALAKSWTIENHDACIAVLAREIQRHLEAKDFAARFSDAGFSVFAQRSDRPQLQELGERMRAALESLPATQPNLEMPPSCSVGLVLLGPHIDSAEEAMAHARSACRQAAADGNAVVRYRPSREAEDFGDADEQWAERIRYALNNDDFYSVRSEIINLDGEMEGLFENRTFLHEEDQDLGPDDFGPVADRMNLASTVDRQVMPGLLRVISGTGDRHFVNVSGNSIQDFSFPSWFQRQLQKYDVQGSQLVLQLTAGAVLANRRAAHRMFEELAPLGCRFSISHFDDRRSNIDLLEEFEPAFVKLAPGLSKELTVQPSHQAVIRNVTSAATATGTHVFADEVNNSADMALLWQCGVKLVSGEFLQTTSKVIGQ